MASQVFISYANPDRNIAEAVCAALEAGGIPCWMAPRNILPGSDYGASIIEALEAAHAMVLIFSSHSNLSPHIKREIERAVNKGIAIIPFRIENVMPSKSLEYFISTQHWLDAFTPPLERHLQHLVDTMRVLLGPTNSRLAEVQGSLVPATPLPGPSASPFQRLLSWCRNWPKAGLLLVVVFILMGAMVLGLSLRQLRHRQGPVLGVSPGGESQESRSPKYPAEVSYSLKRAASAASAAEKLLWLNKALELQPDLAEAYNARGVIQAGRGQETQALKDFTRAISLVPHYFKALNNRGNLYQRRGDLEQALADYQQALTLNANYAPAYVNRGSLYRKKGMLDQALADFNQAISLNPEEGEAYYNRGLVFEAKKDHARALQDFQKAIALKPQSPAAYHGRGYLYLKQGHLDAALADLNQALSLKEDLALAYRHRGQVYLQKGEIAKAQSDFQRAKELESQATSTP